MKHPGDEGAFVRRRSSAVFITVSLVLLQEIFWLLSLLNIPHIERGVGQRTEESVYVIDTDLISAALLESLNQLPQRIIVLPFLHNVSSEHSAHQRLDF